MPNQGRLKQMEKVLRGLFVLFFFPFRKVNNCAENQSSKNPDDKDKNKFVQGYSPPLKNVPIAKNSTNKRPPVIAIGQENFSGTAMLAIINVMKTAWAKLRKTLDRPSLCRRLNFINLILIKIRNFVKYFGMKKVAYLVGRQACPLFLSVVISVCLFCVLCGFSAFSAFAQEIDVKTKISAQQIGGSASGGKEWFAILTIPSKVEGLKHKDPAVRILAIQTSRKVEMVQFIHHGEQCRTKEG